MFKKILLTLLAASGYAGAISAITDPIGFNKITCLKNSDTVLGAPLRAVGSTTAVLTGAAVINGDAATLPVSDLTVAAGSLTKHYVKFTSGGNDGKFYDVTGNTETSVSIDLNGDTLATAGAGVSLLIAEFWTLDTLFPPTGATTAWTETPAGSGNFVQNGNAIVASINTIASGRFTEILMPDLVSGGINVPAEGRYYVHNGIWKRSGSGNTNYGSVIRIYPDTFFKIVHTVAVPHHTIFLNMGEVETRSLVIPLSTRDTTPQDNYIAIPRPLGVTLEALNLRQSGAFLASTSTLITGRKDQLLIFDNELQLKNKAPSAIYYVHGGIWKLASGGNIDRGLDVIPSSSGFIIRKYQVAGHPTSFWNNTPNY